MRSLRDDRLGADTIGGRHEDRLLVAERRKIEQPAEPADVAEHARAIGRAHVRFDAFDRCFSRSDRHACRFVCLRHRVSDPT
jgi:hypothetical protein